MGFESLCGSQIVPTAEALVSFHRALAALDPEAPPAAAQVCGPDLAAVRRLVALPGSFNPPHRAHDALLRAARSVYDADGAACVLSARTVDKEEVSGLLLEDRLWLLCALHGGESAVVATNRGLYVELAEALEALCPRLEGLAFVTGYDKIVQIFDPRYYDDRDAVLEELFRRAEFLVAPRGTAGAGDLKRLLRRPDNARFAERVRALQLSPDLTEVSSTRVRERGELGDVPELAASLIRETGCYGDPPPAGYASRGAAIREAARARDA